MSEQGRTLEALAKLLDGRLTRRQLLKRCGEVGLASPALGAVLPVLVDDDSRAFLKQMFAQAAATPQQRRLTGEVTIFGNMGAGPEQRAFVQRLEAFEAQQPGVKVKRIEAVGETFYSIVPKILTMVAGGSPPDLIRVGNHSTAMFASRGALLPLDDRIANDRSLDYGDFYPRAREAFQVEGKTYALPENGESYAVHYNETVIRAKGLPSPRELWEKGQWTAEAFMKTAEALTEGTGPSKKLGVMFEAWHSENWIFLNGGSVLSRDGKNVLIDQPESYAGLQYVADLVNVQRVAINPVELAGRNSAELFSSGTIGMHITGGWRIARYAEITKGAFEYKTAGLPLLRSRTSKFEISGYAIPKDSKNPDLAWELLKFITGPVGQTIWSNVGIPTRNSVLDQFRKVNQNAERYKPFLDVLRNVRWTPFVRRSPEIGQILLDGQEPIFSGRVSAREAAQGMGQKMRTVLAS